MARVASFTSTGTPAAPGGPRETLAEIMARRKMLAEQQGQIVGPRPIESWTQGAAQLAQTFVNAMQQRKATEELSQGRQGLAELRAGINYDTGPTPEQISQAGLYDPEEATRLQQVAIDAVRAKREREQRLGDIAAEHTYQDTRESRINARELAESQAATAAATTAEQIKHQRDLAEGRVRHITGEEAKTMGLDPTRTWEVTPSTNQVKDITPNVESYRPPTQEEITAYGLKPDQPVRVNTRTGKPESIGGGPALQMLPSEVGAKLGLADEFLTNFDSIKASAAAGEMTGTIDQPTATRLGWGKGGEAYRQIRQGTEGLVRLMTGAGMPQSEAEDRARQYEPIITDDAATLVSKLDGLKAAILSVRSGATFGRNAKPAPAETTAPSGNLPQGVTEDDIAETMRANNMTRQQVLDALKGGANAGP